MLLSLHCSPWLWGPHLVPCPGAARVKITWAARTHAVWPHPGSPHPRESLLPPSTQMQSHSKVSLLLKTVPEQRPWGHSGVGTKLPNGVCPMGSAHPIGPPCACAGQVAHSVLGHHGAVPVLSAGHQHLQPPRHHGALSMAHATMAPCPYSQAVLQTMLCLTPGSCGASRSSALSGDRRQQTQCRKSATLCRKSWRHGCRYWKKRSMK